MGAVVLQLALFAANAPFALAGYTLNAFAAGFILCGAFRSLILVLARD